MKACERMRNDEDAFGQQYGILTLNGNSKMEGAK